MCEYMVSVATKRGISVIYHSLPWYISYIPQCGAFDLNHRCGIYISRHTIVCRAAQEAGAPHREYINRKKENAIFTPM